MNPVLRKWIVVSIKVILAVTIAFPITVLVGLNKEKREKIKYLEAEAERLSAKLPVEPSINGIAEASASGDPHENAFEIMALQELSPKKDFDDEQFRYFVVEVMSEDGPPKRLAFRARSSLVADFLRDVIKCAVPW